MLQVSSPFLIRHDSATPTVRRHALVRMGAPSGPACRSASPDASSRAPGRARTPAWPQGLCRIAPAPPPRRSASSRLPRTPGQAPPLPFQHAFTAEAALHQHEDEWSAGVQLHDGGLLPVKAEQLYPVPSWIFRCLNRISQQASRRFSHALLAARNALRFSSSGWCTEQERLQGLGFRV